MLAAPALHLHTFTPPGSTDHELRVFSVHGGDDEDEEEAKGDAGGAEGKASSHVCLKPMGSIKRQAGGNERVSRLRFDESGRLLACLGTGKSIELFRWAILVKGGAWLWV